jgi:hypothetical protein
MEAENPVEGGNSEMDVSEEEKTILSKIASEDNQQNEEQSLSWNPPFS